MKKTKVEKLADWFMNNTNMEKMNRREINDFLLEQGCDIWNDAIFKLNIKSIHPQSVIDMTPKFLEIFNRVVDEIEYRIMKKKNNSNTYYYINFENVYEVLRDCAAEIGYGKNCYEIGNGYSVEITTYGNLMEWEVILYKDNKTVQTYCIGEYYYNCYEFVLTGDNVLKQISNDIIEYINYAENNN